MDLGTKDIGMSFLMATYNGPDQTGKAMIDGPDADVSYLPVRTAISIVFRPPVPHPYHQFDTVSSLQIY